MAIKVSAYKKVTISKYGSGNKGESVTGSIPMILEEDVTLNLESNFEPYTQGFDSKIVNALGSASRDIFGWGFSGSFEATGFQVWKSTAPISLNLPFTFHVGIAGLNDAYLEVYRPMIELCKLPLPTASLLGNMIPPGPSPVALLNGRSGTQFGNILSLRIANILSISNVVVKRAEPTWSNEFDNKGYPIWGKVSLEIESVLSASVQLIDFANAEAISKAAAEVSNDYLDAGSNTDAKES
jgi:hypothetical protein